MQDFIQADDVAALIGLPDGAAFLRRRARLERDAGFPRPMPTSQRPLIWARARVLGWLQDQTQPGTTPHHASARPTRAPHLQLLDMAARP